MCHYTLKKSMPGKVTVSQSLGEMGGEDREQNLLRLVLITRHKLQSLYISKPMTFSLLNVVDDEQK